MSLDPNPPSRSTGTNFAITLLALAVSLFLANQITATSTQKKAISWQMTNGDKQITNIKANEEQLTKIIQQQGETVKQVGKLEEQLKAIFEDLLDVAEKDKDPEAQAIVAKFGIAKQKKEEKKEEEKKP